MMTMRVIKLRTDDFDEAFYGNALRFLEPFKRDRALRYRNDCDRKSCILGDHALRQLVSEISGCPCEDVRISADDKGCPFVLAPDDTGLYCSVSHSGIYVAAAVSDAPVGIDIEKIEKPDMELAGRICTADELKLLEDNADKGFCRIWTVKEAYLKCIGTGITDISDLQAVYSTDLPSGYTSSIDEDISGYIVTLVTRDR